MEKKLLTFLFTDIEGSTRLWEQNPYAMSSALTYHDAVLVHSIKNHHGKIFKTVGDGVCAVFTTAADALQAAFEIQHRMAEQKEEQLRLSVRIGLHTGEAEERDNDYFGLTLNRVARITNVANGGQILLSAATREFLSAQVELRDLRKHRLRDLNEPEHLFQVIIPGIPVDLKPIRSLIPRPNNLPAQLTSFVGRKHEIFQISKLLGQETSRLLTLLGMGGIGKTRLALQIGASLLDVYEDGVFFVSLVPATNTDAVLTLIAQALKIQDNPEASILTTLRDYLQERDLLLILDNFEHVMDAAPMVNELLVAAPKLRVIATSREGLFIYGEQVYHVPPLELPEPQATLQEMLDTSAVALLVERIKAWDMNFALSPANAPHVLRICQQLEGLPLALELAAARVRDLSLVEMADQLHQRLSLLSKGPRDLPGRQQTIRGTIEWSYLLLSPSEQRLFARLAVFEDRFMVEAAQAVTAQGGLAALLNKSLLQESDKAFSMLAVLREYAMERLIESGELAQVRQRHAEYYLHMLESAEPHLSGRDQIEWFNRLRLEYFNLQAALSWFVENQDWAAAGTMTGILWRYWGTQSLFKEADSRIQVVLSHADALPALVHAKVTQGAGRLALLGYQYEQSIALQKKSLELYQSLQDKEGQAAVLLSLGETVYQRKSSPEAEAYFQDSLNLFRALDNQAGIGRCLNNLGKIAMQAGDFAKAETLMRESLTLAREHGSSEGVALALYNLANALRAQERFEEARKYYSESLAIYRSLKFDVGIAVMLNNLGFATLGVGQPHEALAFYTEALTLLQDLDEVASLGECMVGIAATFLALDKRDISLKALAAGRKLLDSLNTNLEYANQTLYDRAFAALQAGDWQAVWAAGQAMSLQEIIHAVMQEASGQVPA